MWGGASVSPADIGPGVTDSTTLLLVEDDLGLRTFLADNLTADGFDVLLADSVRDAVRLLEYKQPDLALVDLGLPDGSGLDLIRQVREADGVASRLDPGLPLVILTGRVSELDRVRGFDRGADDFVCKPFSYAELRGRMTAILRRTRPRQALGRLRVGDLEIDPPSREVRLRGRRVVLVAEGVRAAQGARGLADARVHEGGAAARRLGLPLDGRDPDAGLARLPAAPEARHERGPLRGQRVGRRLSPGRRARGGGGVSGPRSSCRVDGPVAAS